MATVAVDCLAEAGSFSVFSGIEEHDAHQHKMIPAEIAGAIRQHFTKSFYIECHPGDIWANNNTVRCLCAKYLSGANADPDPVTTGDEAWYVFSIYIPTNMNPAVDTLLWELHHPASLYSLQSLGVAPFAVQLNGGNIEFRHLGGNGTVGQGYAFGQYHYVMTSISYGTWLDFKVHIKFSESSGSSNAIAECWVDKTGNAAWPVTPQYTSATFGYPPTMPFCNSNNVHNVQLYTENGQYTGNASISKQMITNMIGWSRQLSNAAADAVLGGSVTPPPVDTQPARYRAGKYQTGAQVQGSLVDYMRCQKTVIVFGGVMDALKMIFNPSNLAGTENIIPCVWADNGGEPGVLLAKGTQFNITALSQPGEYGGTLDLSFLRNVGDFVWIGDHHGGVGNIAYTTKDSPGTNLFRLMPRAFSLGPTNWDPTLASPFDIEMQYWLEGQDGAPQFTGMTVTDDFNRSNVGPPPGSSWTANAYA